jgi:hypothetical protein
MIPTRISALESLRPGQPYVWVGTDYSGLDYQGEGAPPSELEIDAEWARLLSVYAAAEYARLRVLEYPGLDALVVALWEHVIEGRPEFSAELQALRLAVKAKYPKP